jgi:cytochrome c peroxidase
MHRCAIALFLFATSCATNSLDSDSASDVPNVLESDGSHIILNTQNFPNDEGIARTFNINGFTNLTNAFTQDLGTNGRTCFTCHDPANGWSIGPDNLQARFDASDGTDPVFRTVDGSNSPNADVSTVDARRIAYSMLLAHGDIRVGRPIPDGAEFALDAVDDPYGFASATELSLFRRPRPSMNLRFIQVVMWDGRETFDGHLIPFDLNHQAHDATLGHAQAAMDITDNVSHAIVRFESALYAAQYISNDAGRLNAHGARGGPEHLASVPFYRGITRPGHTFALFDAWNYESGTDTISLNRLAVARGQQIFNTKQFMISGAAGVDDQVGSCSTCHNTPDVGGHSTELLVNIGIADGSRRAADMPLYTLRNLTTGDTVQTTDPGLALSTGKWADIGRFAVPNLRGIETRSPYFHNGQIDSIEDLVDFYNTRFNIGLTDGEKADLVIFVKSL